jgi:hypothetical protein
MDAQSLKPPLRKIGDPQTLIFKPIAIAPRDSVLVKTVGALTASTGSPLADAIIGGALGYLVAPKSERTPFIIGGASAAALTGVIGLIGTAFVGYERRGG